MPAVPGGFEPALSRWLLSSTCRPPTNLLPSELSWRLQFTGEKGERTLFTLAPKATGVIEMPLRVSPDGNWAAARKFKKFPPVIASASADVAVPAVVVYAACAAGTASRHARMAGVAFSIEFLMTVWILSDLIPGQFSSKPDLVNIRKVSKNMRKDFRAAARLEVSCGLLIPPFSEMPEPGQGQSRSVLRDAV